MAEKLKLEMVTPYKRVLSVEVDEVTAPGAVGEFGVLPDHTSLLTTLKVGELTYKQGNETFHVAVNWGYVEVEDNVMTVLVETAFSAAISLLVRPAANDDRISSSRLVSVVRGLALS